jgi:uncharacterized protein
MGSFRPLTSRSLRWRAMTWEGVEHLTLALRGDEIVATSAVIGEREGVAYGATYTLVCDSRWRVRRLDLSMTDGRSLILTSDGEGHWAGADGAAIATFDGCVDIDLSGSPLTNTLPIRRLDIQPEHGVVSLEMLYVPFDTLEPLRDGQHYRCLEIGRRFRYEAADRSFAADIIVDAEGLVLDYPPLFTRADKERRL